MTGFDPSAQVFRNQSPLQHVVMVVVGAFLAVGSHVLLTRALGGPAAVYADGLADVRRLAIALSGVLVGTYLAVA